MVENRVADHAKESNVQFAVHSAGLTLEEGGNWPTGSPKPLMNVPNFPLNLFTLIQPKRQKIQDVNKVGK